MSPTGPRPGTTSLGRLRRDNEQYRDTQGRGRRRRELTSAQRRAIRERLRRKPCEGVARLRRRIPGLPRNSTAAYRRRLRRVQARRRRRSWRTVRWHLPGAVWAIDGTWLDRCVIDMGRRALVVVELNSKTTMCLEAVRGERGVAVVACLERLIAGHGAPLVLKADNGSAFVCAALAALCDRYGITLMHSPVRRPRFNGSCEVSGRWAKHRAAAAARRRGSPDQLCQADLDAAVTFSGTLPPIDTRLRWRFRTIAAQQLAAVAHERGLVLDDVTRDHVRRALARVAVQRALELCHILTIEGRAYHQWLPAPAA